MPGLIATAAVIVGWDVYAYRRDKEMISTAVKRLQRKRTHQAVVIVLGLALTAHLIKKGA